MPANCGRALVIPRELSVSGSDLVVNPILETSVLRVPGSHTPAIDAATNPNLASGSQVEIRLNCSQPTAGGKVGIRTLSTGDGASYTEIGYDFAEEAAYVDHSKCCAAANSILQSAPHPSPAKNHQVDLAVFVDGGLIEAFVSGRILTPLVAPDATKGGPDERVTTTFNTAGALCTVESWRLEYEPKFPAI